MSSYNLQEKKRMHDAKLMLLGVMQNSRLTFQFDITTWAKGLNEPLENLITKIAADKLLHWFFMTLSPFSKLKIWETSINQAFGKKPTGHEQNVDSLEDTLVEEVECQEHRIQL